MSNTERWWRKAVPALNDTLINLSGKGIGYAPLENFVDLPNTFDSDELVKLVKNDGCACKVKDGLVYLYIK